MREREYIFMWEECELLWPEGGLWQIFPEMVTTISLISHNVTLTLFLLRSNIYVPLNLGELAIMAEVMLSAFLG